MLARQRADALLKSQQLRDFNKQRQDESRRQQRENRLKELVDERDKIKVAAEWDQVAKERARQQ